MVHHPRVPPEHLLPFSAPAPLLIGAAAPREDVMLEPSPLFYKFSLYFSSPLLSLSSLLLFSFIFFPPSTTLPTSSSSPRFLLPSFSFLLSSLIKVLPFIFSLLGGPPATEDLTRSYEYSCKLESRHFQVPSQVSQKYEVLISKKSDSSLPLELIILCSPIFAFPGKFFFNGTFLTFSKNN